MGYKFREWEIPDYMMGGLERYANDGTEPGDFLRYIICNDFVHAAGHADENNLKSLQAYAAYLHNVMPALAWGSEEKFTKWMKRGGLKGVRHEEKK